ncbi:hypothetical protein PoB_003081000 [Plakobranchus ocellatus]|uniref:Uncharacterized protein n=1 Tax=Plakobranchus ocellatus TaxID=259542 RepID=A0AAV4ABU7_9GAST|nr:hypothetical protein PoB_003081000 [Plakobranchus ocellatus]
MSSSSSSSSSGVMLKSVDDHDSPRHFILSPVALIVAFFPPDIFNHVDNPRFYFCVVHELFAIEFSSCSLRSGAVRSLGRCDGRLLVPDSYRTRYLIDTVEALVEVDSETALRSAKNQLPRVQAPPTGASARRKA